MRKNYFPRLQELGENVVEGCDFSPLAVNPSQYSPEVRTRVREWNDSVQRWFLVGEVETEKTNLRPTRGCRFVINGCSTEAVDRSGGCTRAELWKLMNDTLSRLARLQTADLGLPKAPGVFAWWKLESCYIEKKAATATSFRKFAALPFGWKGQNRFRNDTALRKQCVRNLETTRVGKDAPALDSRFLNRYRLFPDAALPQFASGGWNRRSISLDVARKLTRVVKRNEALLELRHAAENLWVNGRRRSRIPALLTPYSVEGIEPCCSSESCS